MPRTPQEIADDFAAKPADTSSAPTPSTGLWDTIKSYAKSAVESPSLMGIAGGTLGFGLGGPAGAALGAAGGAGWAHTARAADPEYRAAHGVESPTSNAVDMATQAALNAAVPAAVSKFGPTIGRAMQTVKSAPLPKFGEALMVGGMTRIPGVGPALAGTYSAGRAASILAPPAIRGLGRAAELGSTVIGDFSGSLAPKAVEDAVPLLGAKEAPYVLGAGEPAGAGMSTASSISHLPQMPAQETVKDLLSQGVPLDEAIAAASKGEPAGMAASLRNLYRAAGQTPPPSPPTPAYSNVGKFVAEDVADTLPEDTVTRMTNPLDRRIPPVGIRTQ